MKANQSSKSDAYDSSHHSQSSSLKDRTTDIPYLLRSSANDECSFIVQQDKDAASNDARYSCGFNDRNEPVKTQASDVSCGYKKANNVYLKDDCSSSRYSDASTVSKNTCSDKNVLIGDEAYSQQPASSKMQNNTNNKIARSSHIYSDFTTKSNSNKNIKTTHNDISERIFMTSLIKHTGIALAIIIPLAAFSAYAATPAQVGNTITSNQAPTATIDTDPNAIIYKSASEPTTVDRVDLDRYAGTWYEIARLPMYFQRNCTSDVTANYTEKTDGSGIIVTNKCLEADGSQMVAEGLAKPADTTGSKLKVTFLPSWIRWLPVGRADYWVIARDADYQTALVGTPDKEYLWLLARSPNVTQQTYAKYRQIAQSQGYDLKEFTLTSHSNQTVSLVP